MIDNFSHQTKQCKSSKSNANLLTAKLQHAVLKVTARCILMQQKAAVDNKLQDQTFILLLHDLLLSGWTMLHLLAVGSSLNVTSRASVID